MRLTIQSAVAGRQSAVVNVPPSFVLPRRTITRIVRTILGPLPTEFSAPEAPGFVFVVRPLEGGAVKLEPRQSSAR